MEEMKVNIEYKSEIFRYSNSQLDELKSYIEALKFFTMSFIQAEDKLSDSIITIILKNNIINIPIHTEIIYHKEDDYIFNVYIGNIKKYSDRGQFDKYKTIMLSIVYHITNKLMPIYDELKQNDMEDYNSKCDIANLYIVCKLKELENNTNYRQPHSIMVKNEPSVYYGEEFEDAYIDISCYVTIWDTYVLSVRYNYADDKGNQNYELWFRGETLNDIDNIYNSINPEMLHIYQYFYNSILSKAGYSYYITKMTSAKFEVVTIKNDKYIE